MIGRDAQDLVDRALPGRRIVATTRIGADRGVFSVVDRVVLDEGTPASVVVKRPDPGPNGAAAAAAGAYRREALSYGEVLPVTPVRAPRCHLVAEDGDGRASFVLEDLTALRAVDQVAGLDGREAAAVVDQLAALHRRWRRDPGLERLDVRRSTPATFDPDALARGLAVVASRWAPTVGDAVVRSLGRLLDRRQPLVERFGAAGPVTVCHGDPRADNVAFAADGAVLFDWQQLAIAFPQADVAWLAATSLVPEVRREVERALVDRHADVVGEDVGTAWDRYRLGLVLPGLAVLLLAQRQLPSPRAEAFVAASLRRIATAVDDLEVADLAP